MEYYREINAEAISEERRVKQAHLIMKISYYSRCIYFRPGIVKVMIG